MTNPVARGLLVLAVAASTWIGACGGGSTDSTPATACVPGTTQACLGPGACNGAQVCKDDGSGFGVCDCGNKTDGGSDVSGDAEAAVDSGSTDSAPPDTGLPPDDTAGEAEAGIAPLSPSKLSGLSLWLDSDKGVTLCSSGPAVEMWADQSGNFNNAKSNGGCGSVGIPIVVKSDIKGHDALTFGGSGSGRTSIISDDPTLQFGTGSFCVVAVAKVISGSGASHLFWRPGPTAGLQLDVSLDANVNVVTPSAEAHAFFPISGYHVVVVRGPSLEIRIDGAATKGTTSTTDVSYPGASVWIGSVGKEFNLAELVAVKGAVTDAQVLGVEEYMKAKYKLTF